ncbi:TPA: hypothetical protein HA241_07815 [Candidatus Woesearchaeota archaeon]|nr:hypothetical protein [Candidatus Woesearchaeota archaeon]
MQLDPLYLFNQKNNRGELLAKVQYDPAEDITSTFTANDRRWVRERWNTPNGPASKGWTSGTLGWLRDTTDNLRYGTTEYANYLAVAQDKRLFSKQAQQQLTAAVGCAVLTADGYYLIQQRADGLLASRRLDSSAAGMGVIVNGTFDPERQIREKIQRELGITPTELTPTGVHGAMDFVSSQVTWHCAIEMPLEELRAKANPKSIERVYGVRRNDLPQFLIDHYKPGIDDPSKFLIADAVGVFLRALPADAQADALERMNKNGANIRTGFMKNGIIIKH